MVYLHGGNFVHMSASSPVFRGEDFVMKGKVIYVSVDYRLGKFIELISRIVGILLTKAF